MQTLTINPLNSNQARLLRSADYVCFDTAIDGNGDGTWGIRAIQRPEFSDFDSQYTVPIPVETARVQSYDGTSGPVKCFAMNMNVKFSPTDQTWLRRIKTGSRLSLVWTRGNSSPVTDEAGIVVDMLDLSVTNGNVTDTYRVSTYIGYDNTARMVKRG